VRLRELERLQIKPHVQLLVELNNDFNKLKKRLKRARGITSRLLLKQLQNKELLRRLKVVERPQVLQQGYPHLNHDSAEQLSSQQNIDSYIYQLRPIELNTRKYRNNTYCTWLNSITPGSTVCTGSFVNHIVKKLLGIQATRCEPRLL
jgi:hypothetical protein